VVYLNIIDEMLNDIDPSDSSAILKLPHLARTHNLTSYDAAFLELAMRLQLPLAASDQALVRAAADAKVRILQL
jgi:predicted nucleic acid-binding protein